MSVYRIENGHLVDEETGEPVMLGNGVRVELSPFAPPVVTTPGALRPMPELSSSGLLWLINRQVFHPRGIALALEVEAANPRWRLRGNGTEPWSFETEIDNDYFARATATMRAAGA